MFGAAADNAQESSRYLTTFIHPGGRWISAITDDQPTIPRSALLISLEMLAHKFGTGCR